MPLHDSDYVVRRPSTAFKSAARSRSSSCSSHEGFVPESLEYGHGHSAPQKRDPTFPIRKNINEKPHVFLDLINSVAFLRTLGIILHICLVLFHILLLVLTSLHIERAIVLPLGPTTDRLSVLIPAASQFLWVMYLAGLLVVTQTLALHYMFKRMHSLTATHDVMSAWTGLGSATLSLFNQITLPSSVIDVSLIFGYLILAQAVHVTAPALLSFTSASINVSSTTSVVSWHPNLDAGVEAALSDDSQAQVAGVQPKFDEASTLFTAIPDSVGGLFTTPGLFGNILYDVPVDADVKSGLVYVNMASIDVKCGTLPNARQLGRKGDFIYTLGANSGNTSFMIDVGYNSTAPSNTVDVGSSESFRTVQFDPILYNTSDNNFHTGAAHLRCPNSGQNSKLNGYGSYYECGQIGSLEDNSGPGSDRQLDFMHFDILFFTMSNITDSAGSNASWIPFSPSFPLAFKYRDGVNYATGTGVSLVACSYALREDKGMFNATSGSLQDVPQRNTSAKWDTLSSRGQDESAFLKYLRNVLDNSRSTDAYQYGLSNYVSTTTGLTLDLFSQTWQELEQPTLFRLSDIEDSLSNATALIYWTMNYLNTTKTLSDKVVANGQTINEIPALRLNINVLPLIIGLVSSLLLCFIFLAMVRIFNKEPRAARVSGAGMLQVLWLFSGTREQQAVSDVPEEEASNIHLRRAGLINSSRESILRQRSGRRSFSHIERETLLDPSGGKSIESRIDTY